MVLERVRSLRSVIASNPNPTHSKICGHPPAEAIASAIAGREKDDDYRYERIFAISLTSVLQ